MLDLIGAYENYLTKVKQASGNTVASYMRDIRQFAGWLHDAQESEVVDATQENIRDFLLHLEEEGRSAATRSRALASLKNFYGYVVSTGFLTDSPVQEVKVERGEKKLPQILTSREIELLLAQPSAVDPKGVRDKAMLEVMYATGIRVTELIELDIDDVNLELGIIKCAGARKSRTIPLYPAALKALSAEKNEIWFAGTNVCWNPYKTIALPSSVVVRGGFAGLENSIAERPDSLMSVVSGRRQIHTMDISSSFPLLIERIRFENSKD